MAKSRNPYKTITIKPVSGLVDTRATADEIPLGGYRYVQAWEVLQKGKLCRASGFRRAGADFWNNNADLHDHLEGVFRQPIVWKWAFTQAIGIDKHFCATQNRLYALNNGTGNWKVIGDTFGGAETTACPERTWWGAGYGDLCVFTNGSDKPVYHVIDQPADNAGQSVALIPDLELLNISAVGFVIEWAGITFYCNIVQDGVRKSYAVLWSDYQNPISVKPKASASLAGYKYFDFGEVILNAAPIGNSLLFYTNKGIWQCDTTSATVTTATGETITPGLTFFKRYDADRPGDRCLAFPKTLITTGSDHWYFALDAIYHYNLYLPFPERTDWIHRASAAIFDDIEESRCQGHCGGYEVAKKQIWWSWSRKGESCPSKSLTVNVEVPFVSFFPFGVTAFGNGAFKLQQTVRQWLISECVCTPAGLDSIGWGFTKEGGYCSSGGDTVPTCTPPTCFWTTATVTIDGQLVEDLTQPMDPNSVCAKLAGSTIQDLCGQEWAADQCNTPDQFFMCSAEDYCIKQTDPEAFYYEFCQDFTGCGGYVKEGYQSLLRSGPIDLSQTRHKLFTSFELECFPVPQAFPASIGLRVGMAETALDPNADPEGNCAILWEQEDLLPLKCLDKLTQEQVEDGVVPDSPFIWPIYLDGIFFFYEIMISNPSVSPPDTGGACCLSRFAFNVALK